MPRYDADWIDSLLQARRRGSPPADDVLNSIGVATELVVADIGCGPGFFTLPAAARVGPTGLVYAVDVEQSMLELVARRAKEAGLTHVVTRRSTDATIPLPDDVADLTLCALVLHDLDDQIPFVRELDRITRSTGRIAIVEWTPQPGDRRPNRLQPEVVAGLLWGIGREPETAIHLSDVQYLIVGKARA